MRTYVLVCAASALCICGVGERASAGTVVFSGSTTFQKRVLEPAQAALEQNTGVRIEMRGAGSIKGLRDLMRGEADAAMLSVPLDVAIKAEGLIPDGTLREHAILKDVMVPIVHPLNPVKALTWEQVADINSGRIANWKDVGGPDQRIAVVVPPRTSGTRKFLQESVLNGADFADGAYSAVTTREEIDLVARSAIAIGVLSQGFVSLSPGKVKAVKTKPLVRQLSIVSRGEPSGDLLAVVNYLKSAQAKKHFK